MEIPVTISSLLLIVSLIVPGVIFKRFYFQGQFTDQFGIGPFTDRLITSIFWGLIIQLITFLLYSWLLGFSFTSIQKPLNDAYKQISSNTLPNYDYKHLWYILRYFICLMLFSAVFGSILHKLIRWLKIDIKFEIFRFANQWHYYFTGEIRSTKAFRNISQGKILSTQVDLLIDDGSEKNKMISGFLTQYTISPKTGELENIYLTGAQRYSQTSNQFKNIPGDCLIVPYNRVIDLNLRYNIQATASGNNQLLFNIMSAIGVITLFFCLIYPWFIRIDLLHRIFGFFLSALTGLSFIVTITNPFQQTNRLSTKAFTIVVFSTGALLLLTLIILNIVNWQSLLIYLHI